MPDQRSERYRLKRNWRANPHLANKFRAQAVAAIEDIVPVTQLVDLIQEPCREDYCWDFRSLSPFPARMIRQADVIYFRNAPPIEKAHDALHLANFAIAFV